MPRAPSSRARAAERRSWCSSPRSQASCCSRTCSPARSAQPGIPVVTLGNPDSLWVRVYIAAPKLGEVKLGAPADVTTPGAPGRHFVGRLVEIATHAEFTPRAALTEDERANLVFAVKVALAPTGGVLSRPACRPTRASSHRDRRPSAHPDRPSRKRGGRAHGRRRPATRATRQWSRCASWSSRFGALTAVASISFDIYAREIFGIQGPNGSGKTTTIRIPCGLLAPNSGRATVAGVDLTKTPDDVKSRIGYMSQAFGLYRDLTVEENLRFYGGVYGIGAAARERIAWAMETMRLGPAAGQLAGTLRRLPATLRAARCSTGCRCCSSTTPPASTRRPAHLLGDHPRAPAGTTIIVTTHMDEAERFDWSSARAPHRARRRPGAARSARAHARGHLRQLRRRTKSASARSIFWKEFIQMRRDRATLGMMLGIGGQLMLFGYAVNMDVRHRRRGAGPVHTQESRELVQRFGPPATPPDQAASYGALRLVDRGVVRAAIVVPGDYARRPKRGGPARIRCWWTPPTRRSAERDRRRPARRAAQEPESWARSGPLARRAALDVRVRPLHNPALKTTIFIVPGIIGVARTC